MKMKKNGILATGFASVLALAACGSVDSGPNSAESGSAQAPQWQAPEGLSGSIDYYSANPQGLTDDLVAAFEDRTGVKVNVFAGTTGEITAKIKAEEANPQADVVYLASWQAAAGQAKNGALETYPPQNIQSANSGWNAPDNTFHGRDGSALALVANTDVVSDIPTDWEDLTDPKYKDMLIMPDPRESGTAADLIAAMVAERGEDATWELFDRLFANGMIVQGANGPALDQVTSGSRGIVFGGVDYSAYSAKDKGEPIEVVIPSSGTTVTPRPVMVMKTADNMDAANRDIAPAAGPSLADIRQISDDWEMISGTSGDVRDQFAQRFLTN